MTSAVTCPPQTIRRMTLPAIAMVAPTLMSCPPEEAVRTILELAEPNDPALRGEMEAAFSPGMLLFGQDGLEVFFPRGSLPSQEYGCGFYVAYEGPLAGILQDWALPGSPAAG